jgi:DNA polymerase-3 subunit epsilon
MTLDNVVFIDCETTGLSLEEDQIIELGMVCVVDGARRSWTRRFKINVPIKPEATAVHGIADADLADEKPFSAYAPHIARAIAGKHLAGYNLRRLDLPMLDAALRESGFKIDLTGVCVLDAAGIFFKREPRALADAVRRYCGREHDGAHGAAADAEATLDVLMGQLRAYPDLDALSLADLAAYSRLSETKPADLAGKLCYDNQDRLCYDFGKHRGKPVLSEPGYALWMINATSPGFPASTCEFLERELHEDEVSETSKIDDGDMPF